MSTGSSFPLFLMSGFGRQASAGRQALPMRIGKGLFGRHWCKGVVGFGLGKDAGRPHPAKQLAMLTSDPKTCADALITDEQLMQTYRPPAFSPPYPSNVHTKHSSALNEKTEKWMQDLKVDTIFSPKIYRVLVSMDIPSFGARVYPDAPTEWGLEWACKFFTMQWIWDDTMDATAIGQSPEKALSPVLDALLLIMWSFPDDPVLRTDLERFTDHLDAHAREEKLRYVESVLADARTQPGTVYPKPTSGVLYEVYLDFWKDITATCSPEFCLRFAHSLQQSFRACLQESDNRKSTRVTSIDNYIQMRRGSSAVLSNMVVIDFIYGLNTPDTWFYTPEMQDLLDAVIDIVAWINDIWSFKREVLVQKDVHNMVFLISFHRKVPYTVAADIVTQMVYDRIADFEQAVKDLESVTPLEYRQSFEQYVQTSRNSISAVHDWSAYSMRYK